LNSKALRNIGRAFFIHEVAGMHQLAVKTNSQTEMIDVTHLVQDAIAAADFRDGLCLLYVPHTTAGITINESADPSVRRDILMVLNQMVPWKADYKHMEGNSPAHVKSSLIGASQLVVVEKGQMVLGTWQGIFFCEFDGPRSRRLQIKFVPSPNH
jgi:secondary thiamine-phosphate synthase enzyme